MKTECKACGRISGNNIIKIHKGTSYAFCDKKCEIEYSQALLQASLMTNPFYAAYYLIKNALKSTK